MDRRQRFTRMTALVLALCTGGCVLSVEEVVPAATATFDAQFVGSWMSSDSSEQAVVTREDSGTYHIDYTKRASTGLGGEDGKTGHFLARLGRLGTRTVLDVWPTPAHGEIPSAYDGSFITGHALLVVDIRRDVFVMWALEPEPLLTSLKDRRVHTPYSGSKEQVVLRGDTWELRTVLAAYMNTPGALTDSSVFSRMRTAAPPAQAHR